MLDCNLNPTFETQDKGKAAWIQGDLKYVSKGGEIVEVYNLRTDRFEKNNVIAKYVEKVQEMNQHIMDWNLSCKKSHSGADYESVFKPVDKWKGIGTHKNKKG